MARPAKLTSSLVDNDQSGRASNNAKGRQRAQQVQEERLSFDGKTFDELNPPAKDALLKAIALQLGLIEPDPG